MVGFNDPRDDDARRVIREAVELGINFIDTADIYGESEVLLGEVMEEAGLRDRVVLATKFGGETGNGPSDYGNSRAHVIEACERSLRRLRTDYIDLYMAHMVDPNTPLEELLRTFDRLVAQGKVRYIGMSKHPISLVVEALGISNQLGLERIVCEQTVYNILDRRLENEFVPACIKHGVGLTPIFPLASGVLTGKYEMGKEGPKGSRFAGSIPGGENRSWAFDENALQVAEQLKPIARDKGVSLAEFCLAWAMAQPGITSPVVGIRKIEHVHSAIKACELEITEEEQERVDAVVPPGEHVCDFYRAIVQRPLREAYAYDWASRSDRRIGAFVQDRRSDHDKTYGPRGRWH